MSRAFWEIWVRGLHALRRSALWWATGIVAFVVLNAAFWPSLERSDTLQGFEDMGSLLEAFGAQNIATPAGYLDGQIFALMLPLLLSGMAIAAATALTSGDEDAGRLELLHALPVTRSALWLARWWAFLAVLAAVAAATTAAIVVCLEAFSFDGVSIGRVVAATLACAILAAFHASVSYAAGGLGLTRGRAVGAGVLVLVAGYIVSFVLPIADSMAGARRWSPWYWAIGEQPVYVGVSAARIGLLVAATAALVVIGVLGVNRRDIRSP